MISQWGFDLHSLTTNDFEHIHKFLLAICMSSLKNYLLRSSSHFLIELFGFFFLLLSCFNSLYVLICDLQIVLTI